MTLQTTPKTERVVEGQEYRVEVAIDPRDLLPALLDALGQSALMLSWVAHYRCTNDAAIRQAYLSKIAADWKVEQACVVKLAGGTADELAVALDEASAEPDRCKASDCTNYELDHTGYCPGHFDGLRLIPSGRP